MVEQALNFVVKSPVVVGDGALLGARSRLLLGVTVGAGAVVNPGAMLTTPVTPHTCEGGAPTIPIEVLSIDVPSES